MYTTMQRKRLDGTVSCDPVLLDDTTTIIDGGNMDVYYTYDFPTQTNGEFDRGNLMDQKLSVRYTNNPDEIFICTDCPINIRNRDILTSNGILHQMEKVIVNGFFCNEGTIKKMGPSDLMEALDLEPGWEDRFQLQIAFLDI